MKTRRNSAPKAPQADLPGRAKASRAAVDRIMRPTTVADALALPPMCGSGRIAQVLEQKWREQDALDDELAWPNHQDPEGRQHRLWSQIQALEEAISHTRAASAAGMLGQIAVACSEVDIVRSGSTPAIKAAAAERAERCLYSVAAALSAWTGVEREGFSAGRYMPVCLDKLAALPPEVA